MLILRDRRSPGRRLPLALALAFVVGALAGCTTEVRPDEAGGAGGDEGSTHTSTSTGIVGSGGSTTVSTSDSSAQSTGTGGSPASPSSSSTGGEPCAALVADSEPNDTEATATNLGALTDCDDESVHAEGMLLTPTDVDWYTYSGADTFGCAVNPASAFSSESGVRVCKFVSCEGAAAVCPVGTSGEVSPSGLPGCCGTDSFSMIISCFGVSDDAQMFIRIDTKANDQCLQYSLDAHF